jgi:hypothetical protein
VDGVEFDDAALLPLDLGPALVGEIDGRLRVSASISVR